MPASRSTRMDPTEILLKGLGVTLAAASLAFATQQLFGAAHEPRISGIEHLSIYAKPTTHIDRMARQEPASGVDYTPVGSTHAKSREVLLDAYELIEASGDAALVRLPEGRILRVLPGSRIAALGKVLSIRQSAGKWQIVTAGGVIRQN